MEVHLACQDHCQMGVYLASLDHSQMEDEMEVVEVETHDQIGYEMEAVRPE